MTTLTMSITGMTCSHCVAGVTRALSAIEGVTVEEVTIGTARVQYDEARVTTAELTQAVHDDGYEVVSAS